MERIDLFCLAVGLIGTVLELYLLYLHDFDFDELMYNDEGRCYGESEE